jgi:murein DD-endopeptidase MepM/ murein hydrolase activator NlpD
MRKLLTVALAFLFSLTLYGPTPNDLIIEQSDILNKVANISDQVDIHSIGISNIPLYPFIDMTGLNDMRISSKFGYRVHPILKAVLLHSGIDVITERFQLIMASGEGEVVRVEYSKYGYGNNIIIKHKDGYETLYAHLNEILINKGDYVHSGDIIGRAGQTGLVWGKSYHLHFELRKNGVAIDPLKFIGAKNSKEFTQKICALKEAKDYLFILFGVS